MATPKTVCFGLECIHDVKAMQDMQATTAVRALDTALFISGESLDVMSSLTSTRNLVELHVKHNNTLTGDALQNIFCQHPSIRHLTLSDCPEITTAGLVGLIELKDLQNLEISHANVVTDELLAQIPHNIRVFNLFGCTNFSKQGVEHIAHNLKSIQTLNLGCTQVDDPCASVLGLSRSLQELSLHNTHITNRILKPISNLSLLHTLNLSDCKGLSNVVLHHFQNLVKLSTLDLSGCKNVSGFESLQPSLKHFWVDNCTWSVPEVSIHHLCNLKVLGVSNTTVSDDFVKRELRPLNRLATLDIRGCKNVTNKSTPHLNALESLESLKVQGSGIHTLLTHSPEHSASDGVPIVVLSELRAACNRIETLEVDLELTCHELQTSNTALEEAQKQSESLHIKLQRERAVKASLSANFQVERAAADNAQRILSADFRDKQMALVQELQTARTDRRELNQALQLVRLQHSKLTVNLNKLQQLQHQGSDNLKRIEVKQQKSLNLLTNKHRAQLNRLQKTQQAHLKLLETEHRAELTKLEQKWAQDVEVGQRAQQNSLRALETVHMKLQTELRDDAANTQRDLVAQLNQARSEVSEAKGVIAQQCTDLQRVQDEQKKDPFSAAETLYTSLLSSGTTEKLRDIQARLGKLCTVDIPEEIARRTKAEQKKTFLPDDLLCVVCLDKSHTTLFLPCRHMKTCWECSLELRECPCCRTRINQKFKVFT